MRELEDWKGSVLHKAMILFTVKLDRGESMGVGGVESKIIDVDWCMHFFGVEHKLGTVIWYEDAVDSDGWGRLVREKVEIGVFLWAVNIGTISKETMCEGLPVFGPNLTRILKKCFGDGLVDEDITDLVRCVLSANGICVLVMFNILCWL